MSRVIRTVTGEVHPRPPFWVKLPVLAGNVLQLAGIVVGFLLIVLAGNLTGAGALSTALAVVGIVVVSFCSHSIGHWLVGRIVGLHFAYIGVRGTDHPETYPPPVRRVFSLVPMFTMVSTRRSREATGRWALAAYFAAGQTSAAVFWVLSGILARSLGILGSQLILVAVLAWVVATLLVAWYSPKGDYAKARRALAAT